MALGYLVVIILIFLLVSISGFYLLFVLENEKAKNILFFILSLWAIYISYINIKSVPTNFILEKIIAEVFCLILIIAIFCKIKKIKKKNLPEILLAISVLLGIFMLFH